MRDLTLNEKITIKGLLKQKGLNGTELICLDTRQAVRYYYRCYGHSVASYYKDKLW